MAKKSTFNYNQLPDNKALTFIYIALKVKGVKADELIQAIMDNEPDGPYDELIFLMNARWAIDTHNFHEVEEFINIAEDYIETTELTLKLGTNGHY